MIKSVHMQTLARFKKAKTQDFRNVFFIAIFILVAILGFFTTHIALALDGGKWPESSNHGITYNGKTYSKVSDTSKFPESIRSKKLYAENSSANAGGNKTTVIALDNENDASSGKIYSFDVSALGNVKQNGEAQDVKVDGVSKNEEKSLCSVEGGGGWMVCMVANTISKWMDGIYDWLQAFLRVQPLYTSNQSGLFRVWDYMRNVANVFFVIGFVFVIYSQVTGFGISNYGIKKLLPKLIIAAILINISYYICAILVDISNILGAQTQNLLIGIRDSIFNNGGESTIKTANLDWSNMTAAVLSGTGVVAYGAYTVTIATMGNVGAAVMMILGALVAVIYSAVVALVILAARQAIIIVLVFLAPLAFAANILPNTEKWFEKWKDLFTTMLVMYPLISLLFGGSQLIGTTIIASSNGSFLIFLLGAVVQVVPLAITPTIMRVSGSLLGKFAGIINNPNKGPVDRAKKFLSENQEMYRNRAIAEKPNSLPVRINQMNYNRQRRIGASKSIAEKYQKERFDNFEAEQLSELANEPKQGSNAFSNKYYDARRKHALSSNTLYQEMLATEALNRATANSNAGISQLKAELFNATLQKGIDGNVSGIVKLDDDSLKKLQGKFGQQALQFVENANQANALKLAEKNNNLSLNNSMANNMRYRNDLLETASGVRGEAGKVSALASSFVAASKENKEEIESLTNLTKSLNFSGSDYREIFSKNMGEKIQKDGIDFEITKNLRAATAEKFMGTTDLKSAIDSLGKTEIGGELNANRNDLVEAFKKTKKDDLQFIGGAALENIAVNGMNSKEVYNAIHDNYAKNVSDDKIIKASNDAMKIIWDKSAISNMSNETMKSTLESVKAINENPSEYGKLNAVQGAEIRKMLKEIEQNNKGLYDKVLGGNWKPENIKDKK